MNGWTEVCLYDELVIDRGVGAMVDGVAVAVFRLADGRVVAIDNHDPISRASVMARGLVGSKGDVTYVASPMYKQRFDFETGRCLDDDEAWIAVHIARERDGTVEVRTTAVAVAS